jgi:hypothetical protein
MRRILHERRFGSAVRGGIDEATEFRNIDPTHLFPEPLRRMCRR